MINKILPVLLLFISAYAFAVPTCPATQKDLLLGGDMGGATYVTNIKHKKTYLNSMKDIAICRYEGKKYRHSIGASAKYLGLHVYEIFLTEGDYKKNNSTKGWNARLYGKDNKGNKKYACSAVVINPMWALTDKECWEIAQGKWVDFWLVANVSTDGNDDNKISQEKDITQVKLRSTDNSGNGFALLRMSSPMVLSAYPALYTNDKWSLEEAEGTFYGWGCDGSNYCHNKDIAIHELNKRVGKEDDFFFELSGSQDIIIYSSTNRELFYDGDFGGACLYKGSLVGIISWTFRNSESVTCRLIYPAYSWIRDNSKW
jgi:hypothetical protein